MNQRFEQTQRIRKRWVFQHLFKHGKLVKGARLHLWACFGNLLETELQKPAFGVIVSRKVSAKAVERNRWRRRLREAFRKNQSSLKEKTCVIVVAKASIKEADFFIVEKELLFLLDKAGCLK